MSTAGLQKNKRREGVSLLAVMATRERLNGRYIVIGDRMFVYRVTHYDKATNKVRCLARWTSYSKLICTPFRMNGLIRCQCFMRDGSNDEGQMRRLRADTKPDVACFDG